jgi:integrase
MEEMYAYASLERRLVETASSPKCLLLTRTGTAFKKDSVLKAIKSMGQRVKVKARPHMLRHSYAIHTLLLFRRHPEIEIEPLLYLRDQLGHESVETVMIYLSQLERLAGADALAMLGEFDKLYDVTPDSFSQRRSAA